MVRRRVCRKPDWAPCRDSCSGRQTSRRRGFTLAELLAAMLIMTILVGAMGSTIMLATQAIDDGNDPLSHVVRSGMALEQISGDVAYALSFSESTATAITFAVEDRDADSVEETFRYAWSGTPGDPLTREYNGGSAVTLLEDVRALTFSYVPMASTDGVTLTEEAESGEVLLASYDVTPGNQSAPIRVSSWIGECFVPDLGDECVSWSLTRTKIRPKQLGAGTGAFFLEVRTAQNLLPTTTTLRKVALAEAILPTEGSAYQWIDYSIANVKDLDCDQGICMVITSTDTAEACQVEGQLGGAAVPGASGVWSSDKGSTWNGWSESAILFQAYGTVTSKTASGSVQSLGALRVAVRSGDEPRARVDTSIPTLNGPKVVMP